jgi:hypothetical protein
LDFGIFNPNIEKISFDTDSTQGELIDIADLENTEIQEIESLCGKIQSLFGIENDFKAKKSLEIVKGLINEGFQPIVFCRYIATAKYFGVILKENLPKNIDVMVITSELADEQRKEHIEKIDTNRKYVMVATDCLSEGINLQEHFTAVVHYDLPWNPNRIEQREGRVDRFGQSSPTIKTRLIWGEDNKIDTIVLKVLIKKIRDIQRATGVSITIGEDNQSIMDAVLKEVLFEDTQKQPAATQLSLFDDKITNELELARQKAENLRSIFAHESIKPESIEESLNAVDEAIGDVDTVENFVISSLIHLKATVESDRVGFIIYPQNLPPHLKSHFNGQQKAKVSFHSPTPRGYQYIGRNHRLVEQLCHFMLSLAFEKNSDYSSLARVSEIQTDTVSIKTTLVMFRVRNVIREVLSKRDVIAEEMYLWGYQGSGENAKTLSYGEAKELLLKAQSLRNLSPEKMRDDIEREFGHFEQLKPQFLKVATLRAENLIKEHGRFRELVGGRRYEKAVPVLPPDVMGVYILMPQPA